MPLPKMPAKPADTLSPKDTAATRLPDDALLAAKKTAKTVKNTKPPVAKTPVPAVGDTAKPAASRKAAATAPEKTRRAVSTAKPPARPPRKKLVETTLQSPLSRAASQSGETKLFVLDTFF